MGRGGRRTTATLLAAPPNFDQPHDRNAWVHYAMGDYPALAVQVDNDTVIPFYSWLAKQFAFCDHHFGLGSNSTSGHMLAIGGQTPTLKNPPFVGPHPVWNLPSIFTVAEPAGVSWAAFPDADRLPDEVLHQPDHRAAARTTSTRPRTSSRWPRPARCRRSATCGARPATTSTHRPTSNPGLRHRRPGPGLAPGAGRHRRRRLAGHHLHPDLGRLGRLRRLGVAPRTSRPSPDALHPDGFQVIGGSRIPLIMFGGKVGQGIDSQWHSHA